jgi:L-fuculose-phosphate aldolase
MKRTAVRRRIARVMHKRAPALAATPNVRSEILAFGQRMSSSGLSPGKSGNLSVRVDGGMLITPTGMAYGDMRAADLVEVRGDGRVAPGQRVASSEWRLHLAIYKARPDVGAIVHTHSLNATALSCLHRSIPAFHYMVAEFGGDRVACASYATYGSEELARYALKALGPRHACLLANHGAIAVADTLRKAYERAGELEALAAQYARALTVGRPRVLSGREMARVIEKFKTYGKQSELKAKA